MNPPIYDSFGNLNTAGSIPTYNNFGVLNNPQSLPTLNNLVDGQVAPSALGSGSGVGQTTVMDGYFQSSNFVSGTSGWQLSSTSGQINFSISVKSLDIPDTTTANSFHADSSGNTWWGANVATGLAGATASVTSAGVAVFKSVTLSASVAISGIANNSSTDISLLEYTHDLVFSVTNSTKVAWASGTITMSNGRTFSISAGDTGTMAARTYVYLDTGVSSTALQVTTTASTAMGANKILIAVAQNGSGQPTYQVYGGTGGLKVNSNGVNLANNNWSYSGAFTVGSATQVNWASGTLKTSDGTSYSITSSNTGTMAAKTYIYFDLGTSATAFQTTTTATTAIGDGKILIAVAQNNTTEAVFTLLNNNSQNVDGSNIVTGSITANEIAAGTITAAKLSVSQLSAIAADLGSITAGSLNINSGAASISSAGAAVFKSVSIGGSSQQYQVTNNGIFNYGDGADGTATCDGSTAVTGMSLSGSTYTMTRDVYFVSLTINTSIILKPVGFRIFCTNTLTVTGTIDASGVVGNKGGTGAQAQSGTSGAGGATNAAGYLAAGAAAGSGGTGPNGSSIGNPGNNGANVTNSIASARASGAGGTGATVGGNVGGTGGSTGTWTKANVALKVGVQLAQLLDVSSSGSTVKYTGSSGAAGGGGGAGSGLPAGGGGGGGGGGNGGLLAIYAFSIVISASGVIKSNGGNGGDGGDSQANSAPGGGVGGGGGGGDGGDIFLTYNSLTNSGSITVTGGTKGAIGTANANGTTTGATAGTDGSAGTIYQFQLSL